MVTCNSKDGYIGKATRTLPSKLAVVRRNLGPHSEQSRTIAVRNKVECIKVLHFAVYLKGVVRGASIILPHGLESSNAYSMQNGFTFLLKAICGAFHEP